MEKAYIGMFLIATIFANDLFAQAMVGSRAMEANNEVVFSLLGMNKDYVYRSKNLAGRYDKDNKQFVFILPVHSLQSTDEIEDITIVNELLRSNRVNQNIYVTARFDENLVDVKEFKSPTEVILDGFITIANRNYSLPVRMSLFYNNDVLFYKLNLELDYFKSKWLVPAHQRNFLTGILQLQVVDGKWRNFSKQ